VHRTTLFYIAGAEPSIVGGEELWDPPAGPAGGHGQAEGDQDRRSHTYKWYLPAILSLTF
jgi:hypothetical protein